MKAGRVTGILLIFLLFGPACFLVFIGTRGCEHKFQTLDKYGQLPSYAFTDIKGKNFTASDFKGNVIIFTTIQKTCPYNCSITAWHLDQLMYQQIRRAKKKLGHLKIVSFVVDSLGNPSDDLASVQSALYDQVEGYDPSIWILAKGDSKQIYNIEHNKVNIYEARNEKYFAGKMYTEMIFLVDKSNELRMVLNGKSEDEIRKMRNYVALLEKEYFKEKRKLEKVKLEKVKLEKVKLEK